MERTIVRSRSERTTLGRDPFLRRDKTRAPRYHFPQKSIARAISLFSRERGNLWNITRHYYYDVALRLLAARPRFVSGWSAPERSGRFEWRWMSGTSAIQLPRIDGPAKLRLAFNVQENASVTITFNGTVIERLARAPSFVDRDYDVQGRAVNLLRIDVDPPREQALKLRMLVWGPRRP